MRLVAGMEFSSHFLSSERNIVVEVILVAQFIVGWLGGRAGIGGGSGTTAACSRAGCGSGSCAIGRLNLPAGEVHVILAVVFITPNVEVHLDILVRFQAVQHGALVLHDLELQILRILVLRGDHEFTLGETTGKGLCIVNQFQFPNGFVHALKSWFRARMSNLVQFDPHRIV